MSYWFLGMLKVVHARYALLIKLMVLQVWCTPLNWQFVVLVEIIDSGRRHPEVDGINFMMQALEWMV